jgi:hypothetical protein
MRIAEKIVVKWAEAKLGESWQSSQKKAFRIGTSSGGRASA